jgi:hypothetical protein
LPRPPLALKIVGDMKPPVTDQSPGDPSLRIGEPEVQAYLKVSWSALIGRLTDRHPTPAQRQRQSARRTGPECPGLIAVGNWRQG